MLDLLLINSLIKYTTKVINDSVNNIAEMPLNDFNKIFISHSSKDIPIVEDFVELLNFIGISNENIFCSSIRETGIPLGVNPMEHLKKEVNNASFAFFLLSENFYNSPICLCEMGAIWALSKSCLPILVPSFKFEDMKGVLTNTQSMKINDKDSLNSLKQLLEVSFNLKTINFSTWERKRDKFILAFSNK